MRIVAWMTDDAVAFLNGFATERQRKIGILPKVLEFGTGASTLFFATRSSKVIGFEHDRPWHDRTRAHLDIEGFKHVTLHRLDRPYSDRLREIVGEQTFDIVSIDGRDRVACLAKVLDNKCLADDGVLVIDNTERLDGRYAPMKEMLREEFNCVHFEQIGLDRTGWDAPHRWITTVAWRKNGVQYTTKGLPISST